MSVRLVHRSFSTLLVRMRSARISVRDEPHDWVDEDAANIQSLLRRHWSDPSVKVRALKCVKGSAKGDNYMSVIKRVVVQGERRNGQEFRYSLMVKRRNPNKIADLLYRGDQAFENEISAYNEILKAFADFSRHPLPIPECIFAGSDSNGHIVVMEDLSAAGFSMPDRLVPLTLRHCQLVMRVVAEFHAVSLAMKTLWPERFTALRGRTREMIFCPEGERAHLRNFEGSLRNAIGSLDAANENELFSETLEKLKALKGHVFKTMGRLCLDHPEEWRVLNHGDLWINNLQFRTDASGEPTDLRLLDFQSLRYTSIVVDLMHFFYSSTDVALRETHLESLLGEYRAALLDALRHFLLPGHEDVFRRYENLFTVANIMQQIEEHRLYCLIVTFWLMPALCFNRDDVPELQGAKKAAEVTTQTPQYHERIREVVLELEAHGVFSRIQKSFKM